MKVVTLFENRTERKDLKAGHGLSLHVETGSSRILLDTGKDASFARNAVRLGIDLAAVDRCVLSHGHDDHGGGLPAFLAANGTAPIHHGKRAFDRHALKLFGPFRMSIGLNPAWQENPRFRQEDASVWLDESLLLVTHVRGRRLMPPGNASLEQRCADGTYRMDDFTHEVSLLVRENGRDTLFCGCAHNGILNIVEEAAVQAGRVPDLVVGGFHLMGLDPKRAEDRAYLDALAEGLERSGVSRFLTCHCSGEACTAYLARRCGKVGEIRTGSVLTL